MGAYVGFTYANVDSALAVAKNNELNHPPPELRDFAALIKHMTQDGVKPVDTLKWSRQEQLYLGSKFDQLRQHIKRTNRDVDTDVYTDLYFAMLYRIKDDRTLNRITQKAMVEALWKEYDYEKKALANFGNVRGNVLKPDEARGEQWGKKTIVAASSSQEKETHAGEYAYHLSNAIEATPSVPEAIWHANNQWYRFADDPVSTARWVDMWRRDQPKKRYILVLEGREHDEKVGLHGTARQLVKAVKTYGTSIDVPDPPIEPDSLFKNPTKAMKDEHALKMKQYEAERALYEKNLKEKYQPAYDKAYQNALKGKFSTDPKQSTLIIRHLTPGKFADMRGIEAIKEMAEFKKNNPDAEFMVIISSHGSTKGWVYDRETRVPPEKLPKGYMEKEGALEGWFETPHFGVGNLTEWQFKSYLNKAIGDAPCIVIVDACYSGTFAAKNQPSTNTYPPMLQLAPYQA